MKLAGKITVSAGVLLAAAAALFLVGQCSKYDGIQLGKQLQQDVDADHLTAAVAAALDSSDGVWKGRFADQAARANVPARALPALEHRADSAVAAIIAIPDSFVPKSQAMAAVSAEKERGDSLARVVQEDSVGIRLRDLRILSLRDTVRLFTDSIVPTLTRSRNYWRRRALSACGGDVGYGVTTHKADLYVGCRLPLPRLHLF